MKRNVAGRLCRRWCVPRLRAPAHTQIAAPTEPSTPLLASALPCAALTQPAMSIEADPGGGIIIYDDEDGSTGRRLEKELRALVVELSHAAEAGSSWPSDEVAAALGKLWPYMEDNVDELFYFGGVAEGSARRRLQDVLLRTLPRRLAAPQQAAARPAALLDYARCTWDAFDWEQRDQDQKPWMPSGPGPLAPLAAGALAGVAAACVAANDAAPKGGLSEVVVELRRFLLTCAHACLAGWGDRWGEAVVGPGHPLVAPMLGLALREASTPRPPDAHPSLDHDTPLSARTWQEAAADVLRHLSARALAAAHQGGLDLGPLKPLAEAVPQQVLARGGPPAAALVAAILAS
ncbi:hypothetical protein ABPG77_011095 [Micractinium sp. CCAP 211/92]